MKLLIWLILAVSVSANAGVLTETFNTTAQKDSSTLVWNTELGFLHPQLKIFGYTDGILPPAPISIVSVGDGSHGSFDSSTYSNFGTVDGSGNIVIDASVYPILNFTRFHLGASYTLTSVNGPLVIYSLSTVIIDGVIQCSGEDGSSAAAGGAGGAGTCGGHDGGSGGAPQTSGSNGLAGSSNIASGGIYVSGANEGAGGGGGGGFRDHAGTAGETIGSNIGGAAGAQLTNVDHAFTIVDGSGGGGGGSGSLTEGGGGGGAGGGTVIIHSVDDVVITSGTGAIYASGGRGGGSNTGGGGGSGAGGNVKIFTKGDYQNDNLIDVNPVTPPLPGSPAAGDGGQGSRGRTWIRANTFPGGGGESDDNSLTAAGNEGTFNYVSGTVQVATSKSYDAGSELVFYESITASPASVNVTVEVAGSDDNFVSDNSGWINSNAISALNRKRYLKYRVSINNTNANNPTRVNDVTINYTLGTAQENFTFESGGCGSVKNLPPQKLNWLLLLFLLLPLLTALKFRQFKTAQVRVKR